MPFSLLTFLKIGRRGKTSSRSGAWEKNLHPLVLRSQPEMCWSQGEGMSDRVSTKGAPSHVRVSGWRGIWEMNTSEDSDSPKDMFPDEGDKKPAI